MKKIEKNKIVFAIVLVTIVLFIGGYTMYVLKDDKEPSLDNNQIPIPKLDDEQKQYNSKLDALNDLKEVRERNAPSIYDERLLDSMGVYDPDFLDKEKMRIVDSIYQNGRIDYDTGSYRNDLVKQISPPKIKIQDNQESKDSIIIKSEDFAVSHGNFFHKAPEEISSSIVNTDAMIYAVVNGKHIVKKDYRLELRLIKSALINGRQFKKNTYLYGFVSFKPNRTLLHITNINHQKVSLKAFDFQDGNEGIYSVNNFRAEASRAVVEDALDQINIPAIPSAGVLKSVFQRSNKNVKVTITNNYKLILKPKL